MQSATLASMERPPSARTLTFLECERERAFLRAALGKDYEAAAEAARGL
ncbi:MAG: hypothetical protein K8J09_11720 [Planctomycetes bacterium]|nr:hypothetical protein [Planctomycetota bacterium]